MDESRKRPPHKRNVATDIVHTGRNPPDQHGFVNPPVYRGSTVLFPTVRALETLDQDYVYGRRGTPTQAALQKAICSLEGGALTLLTPSGLSAIAATLLAFAKSGDHILVTDSSYGPTRRFCTRFLKRLGIETTFYDPLIGSGIASLFRDRTVLVFTESPGSLTFEVQDIPAIADVAHGKGAAVILDNTWATPLYFKPFDHGVDVSIQSATKYIVGHADALVGAITANEWAAEAVRAAHGDMGLCPGSEDVYLALRGFRTLVPRLERHWSSTLEIAHWLKARAEVARIRYPALEEDLGHAIWTRDFSGASGLFSIILEPCSKQAVAAMLNGLELFGMGWSWGGYESLVIPFDVTDIRTAVPWAPEGPCLRFHIGLEDVGDLKLDLEEGFKTVEGRVLD